MLETNNKLYNPEALWGAQELTKDHAGFMKALAPLFEPSLTVGDTGIPRHVILKWKKAGLIGSVEEGEEREWSRFNLVEYIWLRLLLKMDDLKLPTNAQLKIREALFYVYPDFYKQFLESLEYAKGHKEFFDALPPEVARMLLENTEQVRSQIEESSKLLTPLSFLTIELLRKNSIASVLINEALEVGLVVFNEYEKEKRLEAIATLFERSFTSININEAFSEVFISRKLEPEYYVGVEILGEREADVIRAIRSLELTELTVKFDRWDNIILLEKLKKQDIQKVRDKVRALARKGTVVRTEMVHDENGSLRLYLEREQTRYPSASGSKKQSNKK